MSRITCQGKSILQSRITFGFTYGIGEVPVPPIPAPVASMSYDDFNSYTALVLLNGLNSGSNEWDNTTPLAAYFSRESWAGIKEWDDFNSYTVDSSLSASLAGSGSEEWSGSYDYYGREAYTGIKATDQFYGNATGSTISGSNLGTGSNLSGWSGSWISRTDKFLYGIKVYDNYNSVTIGQDVSGSSGFYLYNNTWADNWDTRLNVSGSI